jgi:isopentenyl-diphosphate delta-isomerase
MTEEFLDVVNDEDLVIDRQPRSTVHQLGLQHRGVHVLLFTEDKKLLVQKRSADRVHSPSALDCSISEHVKAGESYLDAAIRGLKEEMGVEGIAITPRVRFSMNYGINDNEISVIYEGIVDPARVQFDPVEIAEIGYYSMDEIKSMLADPNINFCSWFIEILHWHWGEPSKMNIHSERS